MFFKDYLSAAADVIDAKFRGSRWSGQNPADIGEVAETLIKEFLNQFLSNQFAIFRGGQIVGIDGTRSKQLDIVLCGRNYPTVFSDKGLYPVESVIGAFSVTSNLDRQKLKESVDCLASIPVGNPKFYHIQPWSETVEPTDATIHAWRRRVPYRCIFAINGVLDNDSALELNSRIDKGELDKNRMPEIVVVNRKGMIVKNHPNLRVSGLPVSGHFHYADVQSSGASWRPLAFIINDIVQVYALWGNSILPKYNEYFASDDQP